MRLKREERQRGRQRGGEKTGVNASWMLTWDPPSSRRSGPRMGAGRAENGSGEF